MLGHARAKKVYDELAEGDLVGALLGTEPGTIDLLIAADVLIYCGGLDPVLGAARHALDPAGWFVFSLERHAAEGYRLQASGRYAHADRYVAAAASRAGLRVHSLQTIQVRLEAGAGLEGALWVLGPSESTPRNLRASGFPAFPGS
jgi:predicted TPR repeat methyltransferase